MTKTELQTNYELIENRIETILRKRDRKNANRSTAELDANASETIKIYNWIAPIKIGSTNVISAQAGAGKSFILDQLFSSIKNIDTKILYQIGEGFRDEDPEFMSSDYVVTDDVPNGAKQSTIDALNEVLDYLIDSINNGEKILFGIDSITRIVKNISTYIPTEVELPTMSGGLNANSFELVAKLMKLAGTYSTGAQVTFIGTCLDGEDSTGKFIIEQMDSLAGAIVPMVKPSNRSLLNDSPSFDFKSKYFSYREIGGTNIASRWETLRSDFKSRPNEFICSKIKECM